MTKHATDRPHIFTEEAAEALIRLYPTSRERRPAQHARQSDIEEQLAVLALPGTVVFPETVVALNVGPEKSGRLIGDILPDHRIVATLCQKEPAVEDPRPEDLYIHGWNEETAQHGTEVEALMLSPDIASDLGGSA